MKRTLKGLSARFGLRGEGPSAQEIATMVANLIGKAGGDSNRVIEQLLGETAKLREDKRLLKAEIEAWKKDAPQDGDVILSGAEITEYEEYKAFGKPSDIKKSLDSLKEVQAKLAQQEKAAVIQEAAKAVGFKASVLEKLLGDSEIELKDVQKTENGQTTTTKAPYVKVGGVLKPLSEYAPEVWPDFMPSLKETDQNTQNNQQFGVQYSSNGAGTGQPGNIVDEFLKELNADRAKGVNPLLPNAGA